MYKSPVKHEDVPINNEMDKNLNKSDIQGGGGGVQNSPPQSDQNLKVPSEENMTEEERKKAQERKERLARMADRRRRQQELSLNRASARKKGNETTDNFSANKTARKTGGTSAFK